MSYPKDRSGSDYYSAGAARPLRLLSAMLALSMVFALFLQIGTDEVCAASTPYLNAKVLHMQSGDSYRLKLKGAENVKWKTSGKKVVSVSKKGKVTALRPGTATITASAGKKKYKCQVTVAGGSKKTLIIYFSATGTTKKAAEKLKKAADADRVRIVPR